MFEFSVGKKPVPYIASSRTSTGGSIGTWPCASGAVEREAVEGEREERGVAEQVAEARAGERARRAPSRSGRPRCARGPSGCRLAHAAELLARPRRCRRRAPSGSGGFGTCSSSASRSASAAASSASTARSSSLTRVSSSSCSGVGLPLSFCRPRSSSTRGTRARQRSSAASSASKRLGGALARERGAEGGGVVAGGPEVDHERESRYALQGYELGLDLRHAVLAGRGRPGRRAAFRRWCAFSTATP